MASETRRVGARARRARSRDRQQRFRRHRVIAGIASVSAAVMIGITMRIAGPAGTTLSPTGTTSTGSSSSDVPTFQGQAPDTSGSSSSSSSAGTAATPATPATVGPARLPHSSSRGS